MPSRTVLLAAVPRCLEKITPDRPCGQVLRSSADEMWTCPTHGPVLTWADAGRAVQRADGRMWFDEKAA
jgi:hypothetical protein